jgi:hypothetical protein
MHTKKLIAGILLATSALTAQAGVIVDRNDVPPLRTVIDFESFDGLIINGGPLSIGAATFSANQQFTVGQNIADLNQNGVWGVGNHFVSFDHVGDMTLTINFAQPTQGVGFDYSIYEEDSEGSARLTARYYDDANNLIKSTKFTFSAFGSETYNAFQSFGYVSEGAGIARMTLTGDGVVFDNLTFTAVVPEPETYAMLLGGLALLGAAARRSRRTTTGA